MSEVIPSARELSESAIWLLQEPVDDSQLDTLIDEARRNGFVNYEWAGKVCKLTIEVIEIYPVEGEVTKETNRE